MRDYLQMMDIYGLSTGKYKLLLLCLPVELSSNHLKVARSVLSYKQQALRRRRAPDAQPSTATRRLMD